MRIKLDIVHIIKHFMEHGCELLEKEYVNAKTKMQYRCSCGNISEINWNNFQQGQRCRKCGFLKTANAHRLKQNNIENEFKSKNCELLSTFSNSQTKITYKCYCGEINTTYYHSFKNGHGCKKCKIVKLSGPNSYNWNSNRDQIVSNKLFRKKCYSLVRNTLNATGLTKKTKSYKALGYTATELKNYIYNHPNWINLINIKWDLDHVFPIQAFVDHGIYDVRLINCLENLQPVSSTFNRSKNNKYNKKEFVKWINKKGIFI